jgi:hypothetical protein
MTPRPEEMPGSFVVIFFRTRAGELRCRVTDVVSQETWVASAAPSLWQLLVERREVATDAENPS